MKKVKYILFGLLILLAVLLITAIFLKKEYTFELERVVNAPKTVVFNLLANQINRNQWDPVVHQQGVLLNSDNNESVFGWVEDGGIRRRLQVSSKENDSLIILEQYIEDVVQPDELQYKLGETGKEGTSIKVYYKGKSAWPFNLINLIIKRKRSQKLNVEFDQVEVLARERHVDRIYNGYKIVEDIVKEKNFVFKRDVISATAIQQFYVQNLGVLFNKIQQSELEMDGMPSGLFYSKIMGSKTLDLGAAIPVAEEVDILGAESLHIKTRMAIIVDYYGDYSNTIRAHNAINSYIADNSYQVETPIIEEYVTDPSDEKDPNKWLTRITYYIVGK